MQHVSIRVHAAVPCSAARMRPGSLHTLSGGAGVLCIATEFPQDPTDIFHHEKRTAHKLSQGPLLSYGAAVSC